MSDLVCIETEYGDGGCEGEVEIYTSRSGITQTARCRKHGDEHERAMDKLEARLQRDYPGYDNPHSSPPSWFDPAYAGERWEDDY